VNAIFEIEERAVDFINEDFIMVCLPGSVLKRRVREIIQEACKGSLSVEETGYFFVPILRTE
jgi:hypothetical protein